MTFLERLQAHEGGLLRIKSQLYWYDGRGWDNNPGRICLLLDAAAAAPNAAIAAAAPNAAIAAASPGATASSAAAHLLIDGSPQWAWVVDADVEMIDEAR